MSYNLKPALTIPEQIELLRSRNLEIDDEAAVANALIRVNYYRFSGYAFLFQKPNDKFRTGIKFSHIIRLMSFDRKLRRILMGTLEYIEIYSRTNIAHWFALAHGKDGGAHYNPDLFVNADFHKEYIQSLENQIESNSGQPFVQHHIDAFNRKMPIWCAVELLSFSRLSKLYSNMLQEDKDLIAANMNTDANHLTNWLHCFSVLRNACAHYTRLYQNICSPKVSLDGKTLRKYPEINQDTIFAYIIAMLRILPDEDHKEQLVVDLKDLIEEYENVIELTAIGFPANWMGILSCHEVITLKPVTSAKKSIGSEV